jgi:hypothetical protein
MIIDDVDIQAIGDKFTDGMPMQMQPAPFDPFHDDLHGDAHGDAHDDAHDDLHGDAS